MEKMSSLIATDHYLFEQYLKYREGIGLQKWILVTAVGV